MPEGLSDCAGWRPRSGLGSAPGSLQRSTASVNLLFPLAPAAGNALSTQYSVPSTEHPAHIQHPGHSTPAPTFPVSPGVPRTTARPSLRARLSSFGACKEPYVSPPRARIHEAQGPGEAQGQPPLPPRPVPVALTGGAAGPPGSGEVEEEAEKEEEKEKRPRRPRHAPSPG